MKRKNILLSIVSMALIITMLNSIGLVLYAAEENTDYLDNTTLPGWNIIKSINSGAPQISITDEGIQTIYNGSFQSAKDTQALINLTPGTPDNFSVEFTINNAPNGGGWISPGFLSNPNYFFNVGNDGLDGAINTQGLFPLVTPWSTAITVDMHKNITGFPSVFTVAPKANQDGTGTGFAFLFSKIKGQHFKFVLKKVNDGNPSGEYAYYINDIEAYRFTQAEINILFPEGKVYLGFSVWNSVAGVTDTITITRLNDVSYVAVVGTKPDWKNLEGASVADVLVPAITLADDSGYHIAFNAPYKSDGFDQATVYTKPMNMTSCSIKIHFDEFSAVSGDWFAPILVNNQDFFSVNVPTRSKGIIPLVFNNGDKAIFELHTQTDSLDFTNGNLNTVASTFEKSTSNINNFVTEGGDVFIRLFKNSDYYDYYINNTLAYKIPASYMNEAFPDGIGYFAFGANVSNGENIKITVTDIDGKSISKMASGEYLTVLPMTEDEEEEEEEEEEEDMNNNPPTNDGLAIYIILVLLSISALVPLFANSMNSRKHLRNTRR